MEIKQQLSALREEIDRTDRDLAALFCRRMELCARIGSLKAAAGLPVRDAAREEKVLSSVAASAGAYGPEARRLWECLMALSREAQERLK